MTEDLGDGYLSRLPEDQRDELTPVNGPGLTALREYLASGEAVAFLGAGVSAPLYPLWDGLISELVEAAAARLTAKAPTGAGRPRPTHCMPGWCRPVWTQTRWAPWRDSWLNRWPPRPTRERGTTDG